MAHNEHLLTLLVGDRGHLLSPWEPLGIKLIMLNSHELSRHHASMGENLALNPSSVTL